MALFPANHTLTQGSLHYRLATLGYQKRNTYGVVSHATYKPRVACTIVWQPWAIKSGTPMGFVSPMKNALFAPPPF